MGHIVFSKERGCSDCPQRGSCSSPCDKLLTLLPRMDSARPPRGTLSFDVLAETNHEDELGRSNTEQPKSKTIPEFADDRSRTLMFGADKYRDRLTPRQYEICEFSWGLGHTHRQAAEHFGVSITCIAGHLRSVRHRITVAMEEEALAALNWPNIR